MYALANSTITISRGTKIDPATGDTVPNPTVVYQGPASITETNNTFLDQATQTPRTVRQLEMRVLSTVDVRPNDFIQDVVRGSKFVAQDVSLSYGLLFTPDKVIGLKRVN